MSSSTTKEKPKDSKHKKKDKSSTSKSRDKKSKDHKSSSSDSQTKNDNGSDGSLQRTPPDSPGTSPQLSPSVIPEAPFATPDYLSYVPAKSSSSTKSIQTNSDTQPVTHKSNSKSPEVSYKKKAPPQINTSFMPSGTYQSSDVSAFYTSPAVVSPQQKTPVTTPVNIPHGGPFSSSSSSSGIIFPQPSNEDQEANRRLFMGMVGGISVGAVSPQGIVGINSESSPYTSEPNRFTPPSSPRIDNPIPSGSVNLNKRQSEEHLNNYYSKEERDEVPNVVEIHDGLSSSSSSTLYFMPNNNGKHSRNNSEVEDDHHHTHSSSGNNYKKKKSTSSSGKSKSEDKQPSSSSSLQSPRQQQHVPDSSTALSGASSPQGERRHKKPAPLTQPGSPSTSKSSSSKSRSSRSGSGSSSSLHTSGGSGNSTPTSTPDIIQGTSTPSSPVQPFKSSKSRSSSTTSKGIVVSNPHNGGNQATPTTMTTSTAPLNISSKATTTEKNPADSEAMITSFTSSPLSSPSSPSSPPSIVTFDGSTTSTSSTSTSTSSSSSATTQENGSGAPFGWTKLALIARSSCGAVYQGLTDKGVLIAVKQLELPSNLDNHTVRQLESFRREINLFRTLDHPNIVRYLGCEQTKDSIHIFLEYVACGSLSSVVNKFGGKLEEDLMKKYTRQILSGLEYLHSKKVIHRDIKGANILVDTFGNAKLADFGCAKMIEGLVTSEVYRTMQGTACFMAPEVLRQSGHGRAADVWSFGCTLLEMAVGHPPFFEYKDNIAALIFNVVLNNQLPEIPKYLSTEAQHFIAACLTVDPKQRPSATQLLQHEWLQEPNR
eukprot:TRINITY_DN12112_c0_g1_i1.p1 TRINITY_DN12112_c0_g1~~TRINITY_DN12112_c0_g1_i1.p1  ORF type:complete len:823 (-),score=282.37 TRINITY_DN12112_c0_g1_i1:333-2801(-)